MNWSDLGINIGTQKTGQVKTLCPECHSKRTDKKDKSLSCNLETGAFNCHYCNWHGNVNAKAVKTYLKPTWMNNTMLSNDIVKWFDSRGINQSTLLALRVTEGEEYMPQKGKNCQTIQFNYFVNDTLLNVKYRTLDKYFKLVSNAELVPYNIDSIYGQKTCIITEGEIDCLSFVQCGFYSVISIPNGATTNLSYLDRFIETHFEDKEEILIAVDTDLKGITLKAELIRRLGAERCKVVTYEQDCKDINELLCKPGCGVGAVQRAVQEAKFVKIDGIFEVSDVSEGLDVLYKNGLSKGAVIGHSKFDDLISWVTGRLCIVTGIPSHGKSEFLDEIIYRLNLKYKWRVAYFSPENHPLEWHISKVVSKLTGKPFNNEHLSLKEYDEAVEYLDTNYFFIAPKDSSDVETILEKALTLVKRKGIKILVVDPYNKLEHNIPRGISETQYVSMFLDQLINFSKKHNLLCFLVAHPVKMKMEDGVYETPNLYSINGSSHFYNKADYGLSVYRNIVSNTVEVHILKVKFRHLGKTGVAGFHFNINNGRYVEVSDNPPLWDNQNQLKKQIFNNRLSEHSHQQEIEDWDLPA